MDIATTYGVIPADMPLYDLSGGAVGLLALVWFQIHTSCTHRLRCPFPGELEEMERAHGEPFNAPTDLQAFLAVRQTEPGLLIKSVVWGCGDPEADEATAHWAFDWAVGFERAIDYGRIGIG